MKLLFNKTEYFGQWFDDDETPEGFTEKVPPHTGVIFDEDSGEWVLIPEPEQGDELLSNPPEPEQESTETE
jgi:hypothetical protein